MKKILFIPPTHPWYLEAHYEYLIRYLSDEFFIEMAGLPYPPYENFLDRYPETSPLQRNPDDYDLLVPLLASHWVVTEREKYKHKIAVIQYEPGEGDWHNVAAIATTTPVADEAIENVPHYNVRFGIDTDLFRPIQMLREDNLLHVGVVGTHVNPRRQIEEGMKPLFDMPGVRFMFFPSTWVNNGGHEQKMESLGGKEFLKRVVAGEKYWTGLPNIYNRMDVLLRIDNSYGYSFPTLEAAACGVPVITTYQGIDHFITEAGGGILIVPDPPYEPKRYPFNEEKQLVRKVRSAIELIRDNPNRRIAMGVQGRNEIVRNWQWNKFTDGWRVFLRGALKNVKSTV